MDVDNFLRLGDIIFYHEELFLFFLKRRERATISFSNLFSFVTSQSCSVGPSLPPPEISDFFSPPPTNFFESCKARTTGHLESHYIWMAALDSTTGDEDRISGETNGMPFVSIATDDATATVYLHGAHVSSWTVGGEEMLFMSKNAIYNGQKALRGGVPICFPQFGDLGPVKAQHGFARNLPWTLVDKV